MSKPFILITGDDSVRAEGIILLKRVVEKFADFAIVATKDQQSAVGAALGLKGGEWGREVVDGHDAYWVTGYPSDAVYFAFAKFKDRKFDLVLSGMNHGENIENTTLPRSGTIAAAFTAAASRFTPAVAFSRRISSKDWHSKQHDGTINADLLEYPGKLIEKIIKAALEYDFPARTFWNANFPEAPTTQLRVLPTGDSQSYPNNMLIAEQKYNYDFISQYEGWDEATDSGALSAGVATLTPCRVEYTDHAQLQKLEELMHKRD